MATEYRVFLWERDSSGVETGNSYEEWYFSEFPPKFSEVAISLGVSIAQIINIKEI